MFGGVGGAIWMCTRGINKFLKFVFRAFICVVVPMLLVLWCMHRMCMVDSSTCDLFISSGFVGSSYVIVSTCMCAIA